MNEISYASAVGSIMYAMLCTRPDVAYALGVASRFLADPGEDSGLEPIHGGTEVG